MKKKIKNNNFFKIFRKCFVLFAQIWAKINFVQKLVLLLQVK